MFCLKCQLKCVAFVLQMSCCFNLLFLMHVYKLLLQHICRTFAEHLQNIYRTFAEHLQHILVSFLKQYSTCAANVQLFCKCNYSTFKANLQNICRIFAESLQNIWRTFAEHLQHILVSVLKQYLHAANVQLFCKCCQCQCSQS